MCLVVLLSAHFPQVRTHRLLAVRKVLLCLEVDLVLRHLHQVVLACLDGS